jgi:putative ABC transport system ATP-binding protein
MSERALEHPPSPAAIVISEIGRRDPRGSGWLIRDVSFAVHPGDRLAIAGATGSGKTVLLRAIALLDPLHAGSIHWRGHVVLGDAVPDYRTHVMYIHQRPALCEGTVEENLRRPYALRAYRTKSFDRERVFEHLDQLGRSAMFLAKSSRDLSGGEAQIVALLRAIQLDASVLLLDEPTASLDKATAGSIEALVDHWFRAGQGARAIVWVSHDPQQLGRVADRHLCMRFGCLSAKT